MVTIDVDNAWTPVKLSLYSHKIIGYKDPANMVSEAIKLPLL